MAAAPSSGKPHVLIIGCGVIGLSTGIYLQKHGYTVSIWSSEIPPNVTSNAAAAVWYPFAASPPDKVRVWAGFTLKYYNENIVSRPGTGTFPNKVVELFHETQPMPYFADVVPGFRHMTPKERAEYPPRFQDGFICDAVVMDTSKYMNFLLEKFKDNGGFILVRRIGSISEALQANRIVINCCGLGARELVNDTSILPKRGQIVRVAPVPGVTTTIFDDHTYIIPRSEDIVLGGTVQLDDWDRTSRQSDIEEIIKNCTELLPALKGAKVVGTHAGLRPARPEIRLEQEARTDGNVVIHNYGHGGSGFTVAWGCAHDVWTMLENHLREGGRAVGAAGSGGSSPRTSIPSKL